MSGGKIRCTTEYDIELLYYVRLLLILIYCETTEEKI